MNRRDFLKSATTLGGAAFAVPSLLNSLDFSSMAVGTSRVAFVKSSGLKRPDRQSITYITKKTKDFFVGISILRCLHHS